MIGDSREKIVVLKITYSGRRPGFWTRHQLKKRGYDRYKQSSGKLYWKKEIVYDSRTVRKNEGFCDKKGLYFSCTDINYTRSSTYRRTFFQHDHGILGRGRHYICAYCGAIKSADKITVDHLLPIYGVSTQKKYRLLLRLLGMKNVNDVRNLVPACERCNQKKGSRGGFWILRGLIGRHRSFWIAVYVLTAILLGWLIWYWQEIGMMVGRLQETVMNALRTMEESLAGYFPKKW